MSDSAQETTIAQKILAAAVGLFARKGFAATSTREIAESAGVTKPMLYYYYQNKEGLCRAALTSFFDPFQERLKVILEEQRPPRDHLVEVVWAHLDNCQANKEHARLFYSLYFGPEELAGSFDIEHYALLGRELLGQAVRHASQNGLIRPGSEESFDLAITGFINLVAMASFKTQTELTRNLAEKIVDDLLAGFGQPPPTST
ncbi:MAG: TetR/AcrR family transcriptional regulator [Planctomycetota bacterium]